MTPKKKRTYASQRALSETIIDIPEEDVREDDDTGRALVPIHELPVGAALPVPRELSIAEIAEHKARAREFMATVMTKGIDGDYAVIPGTGNKPSLLKPGAEKLARLFGLAIVRMERTTLERFGDEGFVAGYAYALAGPDGRVLGEVEAFAAEAEKTFEKLKQKTGGGAAILNTLTARAAKRAFVRAVIQATGVSDLFSSGDADASDLLNEEQRALYVAMYRNTRREEMAVRNATKIKQVNWEANVAAAVDDAADRLDWDEAQRDGALAELLRPGATALNALQLIGETA